MCVVNLRNSVSGCFNGNLDVYINDSFNLFEKQVGVVQIHFKVIHKPLKFTLYSSQFSDICFFRYYC